MTSIMVGCFPCIQSYFKLACQRCGRRLLSTATLHHGPGTASSASESDSEYFTVAIEGNVGCGKSTLLKYFKELPVAQTVPEPVSKWTNIRGYNALKLLYEDPGRWSFAFNNYVMLTRLQIHDMPHTAPVKMIERSLQSQRYVFLQYWLELGTITGLEYSILESWFDHLLALSCTKLDLIVYLRAPPEICYQRMCKRARKEESIVPFEFVEALHTLHDDWLIERKFPLPSPVLVVDASPELGVMHEVYEKYTSKILCNYV